MDLILHWIVVFLSVFAAFVPMVVYLFVIWWLDRYHRQPVWLVGSVFLWGALGAIIIGVTGSRLFSFPIAMVFGEKISDVAGAVIIAPFVEELAKSCILLIAMLRTESDGPADGIVLGAAAGLGFGMTENFLYFTQVYDSSGFMAWVQNVFVRTLYSAVVHCVCTATVGMGIGLARTSKRTHRMRITISFILTAMAIHAFWNASMVLGPKLGNAFLANAAFTMMPLLVLLLLVAYQYFLYREGQWIKTELQEEVMEGTLPPSIVSSLVSPWNRLRNRNQEQSRYIDMAMKLAVKRHQWKRSSGLKKERLALMLVELRERLRTMRSPFEHLS
jgi:RsiW-degrading membrane proteinase PrsW (M82 family)